LPAYLATSTAAAIYQNNGGREQQGLETLLERQRLLGKVIIRREGSRSKKGRKSVELKERGGAHRILPRSEKPSGKSRGGWEMKR